MAVENYHFGCRVRRADFLFLIPAGFDATFSMVCYDLSNDKRLLGAQLITNNTEVCTGYAVSLNSIEIDFHVKGIVDS